jgi:hypothetical protein
MQVSDSLFPIRAVYRKLRYVENRWLSTGGEGRRGGAVLAGGKQGVGVEVSYEQKTGKFFTTPVPRSQFSAR